LGVFQQSVLVRDREAWRQFGTELGAETEEDWRRQASAVLELGNQKGGQIIAIRLASFSPVVPAFDPGRAGVAVNNRMQEGLRLTPRQAEALLYAQEYPARGEGGAVTEEDWDRGTYPERMLEFLRDRASDRKLRLFACACCRRIWELFPDEANRALVVAVEHRPDGTRDDPDLWEMMVASSAREHECRDVPAYWVAKFLGRGFYKMDALRSARVVADMVASRVRPRKYREAEWAAQAALLRDIFGNPFRLVQVDQAWLAWHGGAAVKLAQAIYEERELPSGHLDAARLAVLADMLEEAGCSDPDLLGHLRSPGPHVRGCRPLDLLLQKA
jgi:hypothetical protein